MDDNLELCSDDDRNETAVMIDRLAELDIPSSGCADEDITAEIERENIRDTLWKRQEIVESLINADELHPESIATLKRYFGTLFSESCDSSFWRLTGCELG